ncbi:thioesterase family protein [Inmirania thermothiophila]|uniref:Acyl-CoA thioesterase FadM n=1 Tax=Inmirania thermothiophila TaxID=1750597 RepID=A0A3N1Y9N8_9GAMM|nr:thioesterase family protein [Inmirania thermothiophila]ROR34107.1 acyl-CoA thioesterase FadM [Inmirania thermothiophila]
MNLWLRLLWLLGVRGWLRPRVGLLEPSVLALRVWPGDLDLNGHMNNARYLAVMDLGRLDLLRRAGLLGTVLRRRWRPVLGAAAIRFRRPLAPLARYALVTRVAGWDEKWFYLEQRFERGGDLCAAAWVQGLFAGPRGRVPTAEVLAAAGHRGASPALPEAARILRGLGTDGNEARERAA